MRREFAAMAEAEVAALLRRLPPDVAALAANVAVRFEPRPSKELVNEGVEPDVLGLFDGTPFNEELSDPQPMPPYIFLYLENLRDYAGGDPEIFREEVRLTFLHELGHYLGWDEGELGARGLG